jgi:uncharacterized protein YcbX
MAPSTPIVSDLYVYPIKSCSGVRVQAVAVTPLGERRFVCLLRPDRSPCSALIHTVRCNV